jgi:hypothetical protein
MTLAVSRLNQPNSPLIRLFFPLKVDPRYSKTNPDFPSPNPSSFFSISILGNNLPSTASLIQKALRDLRSTESSGYIQLRDAVVAHIRQWKQCEPTPYYEEREYLLSEPAARKPVCKVPKTRVRNGQQCASVVSTAIRFQTQHHRPQATNDPLESNPLSTNGPLVLGSHSSPEAINNTTVEMHHNPSTPSIRDANDSVTPLSPVTALDRLSVYTDLSARANNSFRRVTSMIPKPSLRVLQPRRERGRIRSPTSRVSIYAHLSSRATKSLHRVRSTIPKPSLQFGQRRREHERLESRTRTIGPYLPGQIYESPVIPVSPPWIRPASDDLPSSSLSPRSSPTTSVVDDSHLINRKDPSSDSPFSINPTSECDDFIPISTTTTSFSNTLLVVIVDPLYCLADWKPRSGVSSEQVAAMFLQCRKQGRGTKAREKLWKQLPLENGPPGRFALEYDGKHFAGLQIQLFKEETLRDKKSCPFGCTGAGGIRQDLSGTTYHPLTVLSNYSPLYTHIWPNASLCPLHPEFLQPESLDDFKRAWFLDDIKPIVLWCR